MPPTCAPQAVTRPAWARWPRPEPTRRTPGGPTCCCGQRGLRGNLLARLGQSQEGRRGGQAALDQALAASLTDTAADLQQRLADALEHAGDYRAATAVYAAAFQFCDAHGADARPASCAVPAPPWCCSPAANGIRTAAVCEDVLASAAAPHAAAGAASKHARPGVHAMRGAARQARPHLLESHLLATRIELAPMELFSSWGCACWRASAGSCAEAADRARRMLARAGADTGTALQRADPAVDGRVLRRAGDGSPTSARARRPGRDGRDHRPA